MFLEQIPETFNSYFKNSFYRFCLFLWGVGLRSFLSYHLLGGTLLPLPFDSGFFYHTDSPACIFLHIPHFLLLKKAFPTQYSKNKLNVSSNTFKVLFFFFPMVSTFNQLGCFCMCVNALLQG